MIAMKILKDYCSFCKKLEEYCGSEGEQITLIHRSRRRWGFWIGRRTTNSSCSLWTTSRRFRPPSSSSSWRVFCRSSKMVFCYSLSLSTWKHSKTRLFKFRYFRSRFTAPQKIELHQAVETTDFGWGISNRKGSFLNLFYDALTHFRVKLLVKRQFNIGLKPRFFNV